MNRSLVRPSPLFLGILAAAVVGAVLVAIYSPTLLDFDQPAPLFTLGMVLFVVGGWVVSLCLHEFGHAIVAFRGGDHEVRHRGYLTLDPRHYTDPVLSIVLPILFLIIGGLPLPGGAVLINHYALRSKGVQSLVSFAGPAFNLVLSVLMSVAAVTVPMPFGLRVALTYLAYLQVFTFLLNILPVPGFDGYGVIAPHLSPEAQRIGDKARMWAPFVLFAILIGIPSVGGVLGTIVRALFGLLGGDASLVGVGDFYFRFWAH